MKRAWIGIGLAAALALMAPGRASAAEEKAGGKAEQPSIEVVFALDTTGSMSGLIEAAKQKIWAIANTLATTKPAPAIKMGLLAYRDRGDAYVTKVTDLSDDLDAVYKELMAFQAAGGGDGPESVNQALHEAVTRIKWSTDEKTYRVIFLVGDSPPHMDYADDVKYPATCQSAAKAAIVINTVQCGNQATTTPVWSDIAKRSEGQFFRVEQSGGAILASTPFDGELADLSRRLDETRVYYGREEERKEQAARRSVADAIYEKAPAAAQAQRAAFNASKAGERNFAGTQELVEAVANGRVKLADLKDEALPDEMRKMSPEERQKVIDTNLAKRKDLQQKIQELAAKRQQFIEKQLRESKMDAGKSLDRAIYDAVKGQAGRKGIAYEGGPTY